LIEELTLTLPSLRQVYRDGVSPRDVIKEVNRRIESRLDNPIWIRRLTSEELEPYLSRLEGKAPDSLPLYGVPFAIKDNIDLAGIPTTAACEAFAYTPEQSAFVVKLLIEAGAIPIGKTNLDQLATGLVGTRSPYGAVGNAFDPELISGGSSSGSAVAVALGQVSFSLGTDTAGSGRVPAALNNLVGYKPSCGLLSTSGVVPACRTLDCVTVFGLTCADVAEVSGVVDQFDEQDVYARTDRNKSNTPVKVVGVPRADQLEFFANDDYQTLFAEAVSQLDEHVEVRIVDIEPLMAAAKLLYEGAWVAERYHGARQLIEENPQALRPEFLAVVGHGNQVTALDYFAGAYKLAEYKRQAERLLQTIDLLMLPTVGTHYSLAEVAAEPVARNSDNGLYTNFVNLLDMSAIAIPAGFTQQALPFGVTLIGAALDDARLFQFAHLFLSHNPRQLGALGVTMKEPLVPPTLTDTIPIAVCGAHLSGMPLNWQLQERSAILREATHTAASYKLYALPGGPPMRPGLVRSSEGVAIEVEVYDMPALHVGSFLQGIPQPLGLGQLELASGEWVTGFICEPCGIEGATDVSSFGGWRGYIASLD
jgi:allophanate hydrolase